MRDTYQDLLLPDNIEKGFKDTEKTWNNIKDDFKDKVILDIGCNQGYFMVQCLREGAKRAIGIDLNGTHWGSPLRDGIDSPLSVAKKTFKAWGFKNVKLIAGNWETLPFNEKVDVVLCLSTSHYFKNLVAGLKKIFDLRAGLLIFEASPSEHQWIEAAAKAYNYKIKEKKPSHWNGYTIFKLQPDKTQVMDIAFLITTCNRQESCQQLVDSLQGQGDIYVLNDGCEYDIEGVTKQIKRSYRFGKEGYWATVNQLFDMRESHQYYFMLPDDFLPVDNMVERAIALWKDINDPKCACINLYADRIGKECWTAFSPIDKGSLWLTQWVDMCFVAKDIFFYKLGRIPRIKLNWKRKKTISSGVGAHISRTLYNQGCNLYMVKESLVTPQEVHHQSQMHHA